MGFDKQTNRLPVSGRTNGSLKKIALSLLLIHSKRHGSSHLFFSNHKIRTLLGSGWLRSLDCANLEVKEGASYLCWPIAPSYTSSNAGGGGCGVSANEYSCAHHVTWSPNKLRRSTSIFNLWRPPWSEGRCVRTPGGRTWAPSARAAQTGGHHVSLQQGNV
jgi:hypothetical protein